MENAIAKAPSILKCTRADKTVCVGGGVLGGKFGGVGIGLTGGGTKM